MLVLVFWRKLNKKFTKYHYNNSNNEKTLCGLIIPGDSFGAKKNEVKQKEICNDCNCLFSIKS